MIATHAVNGNFNCHLSGSYRGSNRTGGRMRSVRGRAPVRVSVIQNDGVQMSIAAEDKEKAARRKNTLHRFNLTQS
jgi:hypothetical protein